MKSLLSRKPLFYLFYYLAVLNAAVFLGSVALHESGHLLAGLFLGCSGLEMALMNLNPLLPAAYTYMLCPPGIRENMTLFLGLSGYLLIVPFGILAFLLMRKLPERNLGIVMLGAGMVLGSLDILLFIPDSIASYLSIISGIAMICAGEIFLIDDHLSYRSHIERAGRVRSRV